MKAIFSSLFFIFILFAHTSALAQGSFSISGTVFDENNKPAKDAKVFISGSEKITTTNSEGQFIFNGVDAGTFQLSVKLLGYAPYSQNVIIKGSSIRISIALKVKSIALNEVVIGNGTNWEVYYRIFKGQFLGTSANALDCEILNPGDVHFDFYKKKGLLTASADKFLIIENKRLGYKIRYMLKDFAYSLVSNAAVYDGDTNFEQLDGNARIKKQWDKNRLEAYNGSLMHFLRSIYSNTVLQEGFLTHQLYSPMPLKGNTDIDKITIDTHPIKYDTLIQVVDTSFILLKSPNLYIVYDPKKAGQLKNINIEKSNRATFELTEKGTLIKLLLNEVVIDRKGNYVNYRAFIIHGNLARKRIGDQLPSEYQPPK